MLKPTALCPCEGLKNTARRRDWLAVTSSRRPPCSVFAFKLCWTHPELEERVTELSALVSPSRQVGGRQGAPERCLVHQKKRNFTAWLRKTHQSDGQTGDERSPCSSGPPWGAVSDLGLCQLEERGTAELSAACQERAGVACGIICDGLRDGLTLPGKQEQTHTPVL